MRHHALPGLAFVSLCLSPVAQADEPAKMIAQRMDVARIVWQYTPQSAVWLSGGLPDKPAVHLTLIRKLY